MGAILVQSAEIAAPDGVYEVRAVPLRSNQWGYEVKFNGRTIRTCDKKHHAKEPGRARQWGKRWVTADLARRKQERK